MVVSNLAWFRPHHTPGGSSALNANLDKSAKKYDNWDEYEDALDQNVGGQTYARYNDYRKTEIPTGGASCRRRPRGASDGR